MIFDRNVAIRQTRGVLAQISQWPENKRLNVGVWCLPVLVWLLCAAQYQLSTILWPVLSAYLQQVHASLWLFVFLLLSLLLFGLACPVVAGLVAAFFWADIPIEESIRQRLTFRSTAFTFAPIAAYCCARCLFWAPTLAYSCVLFALWLPFLIYLEFFRAGVAHALPFWQSQRPRYWLGDFSEIDEPS